MGEVIRMKGIHKRYPNGVQANRAVDFSVNRGEIHALVGENGAGKSTLMKILYGLEQPDSGEIFVNGKDYRFHSPTEAIGAGIGMVHQNFMLIPSFTVAQNIVLGTEPMDGAFINEKKAADIARSLSERYGLSIDPYAPASHLNVAEKQRTEILKTLHRNPEVLIFDEPTAVLTPQETQSLFAALFSLAQSGKTLIFITHKLKEVKEISQRITVMRDGEKIADCLTKDVSENSLAEMMVGRKVLFSFDKAKAVPLAPVLEVEKLRAFSDDGAELLKGISLCVRAGEVLGVAGVEGNGQRELVEAVTGNRPFTSGHITVNGACVDCRDNPGSVRRKGLSHVPEDRLFNGAALGASIKENLIIDRVERFSRRGVLMAAAVDENASTAIGRYDIRANDGETLAGALSGGNMQKVIVAREFESGAGLLVVSQPTRGIDIGSSEYIRRRLIEQSREGKGVLLVSADLSEILSVSDRIVTLYDGRITGEFDNSLPLDEKELGLYMLGVKDMFMEEKNA